MKHKTTIMKASETKYTLRDVCRTYGHQFPAKVWIDWCYVLYTLTTEIQNEKKMSVPACILFPLAQVFITLFFIQPGIGHSITLGCLQ